ncbi:MAG: hypothetical protein FWH46_05490 [Methanimicrococcus sp.]|nr:hypothetical protein [Methanimicrococcus sp.]
MQEHINLSVEIYNLLKDGRQLSISGITRELESRKMKEHRLIVTGYLRALKDLDQIAEFDLSPSKIYMLKEQGAQAPSSSSPFSSPSSLKSGSNEADAKETDIYSCIRNKISKMTSSAIRLETSVYILTTLFDRPCFESELIACGIDTDQISRYFQHFEGARVFKPKSDYKKYYDEIPQIPRNSPAYNIQTNKLDLEFFGHTIHILNAVIKDFVDVSELVSKPGNKRLLDY